MKTRSQDNVQRIENLLAMLRAGQGDPPLLHYSLGTEYLRQGNPEQAATHMQQAVSLKPQYSAAWKGYGKALVTCGQTQQAIAAYTTGIGIAREQGDKQAEQEMQVFLRRLQQQKEKQKSS